MSGGTQGKVCEFAYLFHKRCLKYIIGIMVSIKYGC
jgi:hypothetical protein